jgi:hypothetical protein
MAKKQKSKVTDISDAKGEKKSTKPQTGDAEEVVKQLTPPDKLWAAAQKQLEQDAPLGDVLLQFIVDTMNYFTDVRGVPIQGLREILIQLFKMAYTIPAQEPIALLRANEYLYPNQIQTATVFRAQIAAWLKTQIISKSSDPQFVEKIMNDPLVQYWSMICPELKTLVAKDPKTGKWVSTKA